MELILALDNRQEYARNNLTTNESELLLQMSIERANQVTMAMGFAVLLFGIPGAVTCVMLTCRHASRKGHATLGLQVTNSVSSMVVMMLAGPKLLLMGYPLGNIPDVLCGLYGCVLATANCINVASLLVVISKRFMAVAFPQTFFNKMSGRQSHKTVFFICLFCTGYCLRFFFWDWNTNCSLPDINRSFMWLFIIVEFILPVALILLISASLYFMSKHSRFKVISASLHKQNSLFMQITSLHCFGIFVTSLPLILDFVLPIKELYGLDDNTVTRNSFEESRLHTTQMMMLSVFYLRHCYDIYVYFACSFRYRAEVVAMLRLDRLLCGKMKASVNLVPMEGRSQTTPSGSTNVLRMPGTASRSMVIASRLEKITVPDELSSSQSKSEHNIIINDSTQEVDGKL